MTTFAREIKKFRTIAGFSQQMLADLADVTKQSISAYETGKALPPPPTLKRLAKALKVDIKVLMAVMPDKAYHSKATDLTNIDTPAALPMPQPVFAPTDPHALNNRIEQLIAHLNLNQRAFADLIGEEPNTISHIMKRRIGVSARVINGITRNIPGLNPRWLLEGDEPMFTAQVSALPFYEVDVTAGNVGRVFDGTEMPKQTIVLPGFADCDFAVPVSGHSMYPKISNGDIIICKVVRDLDSIEYGQIYLIVTEERRMVKYIRKSPDREKILLVSENRERFDDFEIDRHKILHLYLVKGWVNKSEI